VHQNKLIAAKPSDVSRFAAHFAHITSDPICDDTFGYRFGGNVRAPGTWQRRSYWVATREMSRSG
jgi:hypothetical protein